MHSKHEELTSLKVSSRLRLESLISFKIVFLKKEIFPYIKGIYRKGDNIGKGGKEGGG